MDLRVLTWNVSRGRAVPPAGHDLYADYAAALARWPWDVALLQEVPPWWPDRLRVSLLCEARHVLATRAGLLPLRGALGARARELMGGAGGGANAILARSDRIIGERSQLLSRRPKRRLVHGVALACGAWVSNAQAGSEHDARAAIRASREWARAARMPLILGGDLGATAPVAEGLRTAAAGAAGHVLCDAGIEIRAGSAVRLEPGTPSGHAPLAVTVVI
jgi:hypothetical protein